MPARGVPGDDAELDDYRRGGLSGAWEPREDLRRARDRARNGLIGVALFALAWVPGIFFSDNPSAREGARDLLGLSLPVLAGAAWRFRRASKSWRRVSGLSDDDLQRLAQGSMVADEALWSVGRLVSMLRSSTAIEEGRAALKAAELATNARQALVERQVHLERVLVRKHSVEARTRLEDAARVCQEKLTSVVRQIEELSGAVAALVGSEDETLVHAELTRLKEVTQRTAAIAESLDELRQQPARRRPESGAG